jgi:hypothetical protein
VDTDAEVGTANRTEQGTVRSFDEGTRTGSVYTDDGFEHSFTAAALSNRIRHLRFGQRVRIAFVDDQLVGLQIVTLPDD